MFYLGSGDEHCAVHCAFDANNRCDFFYMFHGYCYLGSFNQVGGIGVHHCCPHLTVKINKSKYTIHFILKILTCTVTPLNSLSSRINLLFHHI